MRKQTKIAAVVSAAALLALGASITSFAAAKGTWMLVDGEWYCYDKNGDVYENTFCASNGKEYYVGEDGMLVRSDWVEYDGDYYFVNSSGAKITNDWRLTTPYDDEDADEEWYYFQSTGKRASNKKVVYKNNTFFFDTDGKMLTGWVTVGDNNDSVNEATGINDGGTTYYCDESGARVQSDWVYDVEPGTEDDDADADQYYYYLKSSGKVQTGKAANVKGQTYFFDNQGRMLSGWVALNTASDAYYELYNSSEEVAVSSIADYFAEYKKDGAVYYCGEDNDGHAKKNKWVKLWKPEKMAGEESGDLKWFWFDKSGKVFTAEQSDKTKEGAPYKFEDGVVSNDGSARAVATKKVNSKDYWFNTEGEMVAGFYYIDGVMYYFGGGNDGSMKTGSQSIKDDCGDLYKFYFGTKTDNKGVGVTGNQNNKLYYFGMLIQARDYKYQTATIDGKQFIVNANGSIQHSKIQYKEDGDVIIDAREAAYDAADAVYKYNVTGLKDVKVGDVDLDEFVVIE